VMRSTKTKRAFNVDPLDELDNILTKDVSDAQVLAAKEDLQMRSAFAAKASGSVDEDRDPTPLAERNSRRLCS